MDINSLFTKKLNRPVSIILNALFWSALLGIFIYVLRYLGINHKVIMVLGAIGVIACIIHVFEAAKDSYHLRKSFSIKCPGDRARKSQMDYLRILAVAFVIVTHALQSDISNGLITNDLKRYVFTVAYVLALACNPIYVMISGALLLPWKEEGLIKFYFRRCFKILIPMTVYYVWYLLQFYEPSTITIKSIFVNLFEQSIKETPHYWLLYTILSLYVVFPFFRYMVKDMPYKTLTGLVVVSQLFMAAELYLPLEIGINTFISGWIGIALLGYWVMQEETKKLYPCLIVLGVIAGGVIAWLVKFSDNFLAYSTNLSPLLCMFSVGIFAFVLQFKIFSKDNVVVRFLSKYSFSGILIHWWALFWVAYPKFHMFTGAHKGFGVIEVLLVTLIVSVVTAYMADNLIVIVFNKAVETIEMMINSSIGFIQKKKQ